MNIANSGLRTIYLLSYTSVSKNKIPGPIQESSPADSDLIAHPGSGVL